MTSALTRVRSLLVPPRHADLRQVGVRDLVQFRATIASWILLGTGLGGLAFVVTPATYESRASFIVEQRAPSLVNSGAFGALASELGMGLSTGSVSPQYYADLLRSRSVLSAVAQRPVSMGDGPLSISDALQIDEADSLKRAEETLAELNRRLNVSANSRTSVISLDFTAPDRQMAAQILDLLLSELDLFVRVKRQSSARAQATFAAKALQDAEDSLRAAEMTELAFSETNREWDASPRLKLRMQQLQRRTEVRQTLVTTLQSQLETAKMGEINDTPQLTILDRPVPAAKRSAPTLGRTVGFGIMLGFLMAATVIAMRLAPPPRRRDLTDA